MDNLIFDLIWEDEMIFEVAVTAITDHIKVSQNIYLDDAKIKLLSETINKFIKDVSLNQYFESGSKVGNLTPAFSIEFKGLVNNSLVLMEIDLEIADNKERIHWCKFYMRTELGLLEKFSKRILSIQSIKRICLIEDKLF